MILHGCMHRTNLSANLFTQVSLLFSRSREGTTASGISTLTFSTNDSHTETVLLDISKEKRNQRFLIMVNIIYFVSLLPVNVLK